ncbi:MBL fold metallo-hydrolase [Neolewinella litorea]|uniref:MBL fold metallo-hydrolase n=1 Tax=Neolewinella litorea TaxID=2562452 RepID=A0A4S4NSF7_9BACT|nr:MBL fold metallo-hydrolase [Neolewinella litorea]THH41368.1 MBL fold metallo-hydrolase [Neolewinella litorea]
MRYCLFVLLCTCVLAACSNNIDATSENTTPTTETTDADEMPTEEVVVHPVYHGSLVLTQGDRTIYVDPYGGASLYSAFAAPDLVLITHTHPDHLDTATLSGLDLSNATLVAPAAVMEADPNTTFAERHTLANGESWDWNGINIEAIPAYNPPPKENFHPEGKFNGYVLDFDDDNERIYISGDTEGVPAMRGLQDIDIAFVAMNLPYTMDINQAAESVLAFAPDVVYPYHYRNQDQTKSDVQAFREKITQSNPNITVRLEDWYPIAQ